MKMDNEQFWKLLKPIHAEAEAYCRRLAGNRDDGDDLYQESLLAAMRKLGTLRDSSSFRPWLYSIVINRYKNHRRRFWRQARITLNLESVDPEQEDNLSGECDSRRWLELALQVLTPEDRAMIVLHEIEGWPVGDLARAYGKAEGTIKARLFRSRRKMRRRLERCLPKPEVNNYPREDRYAMQKSETID
jgi:RNA polymerase sigma factor (sigma-70 family)